MQPHIAGGAEHQDPTCLVGQLEEPAPGDVDVVVGPIAVVVRGPAVVLQQLAPLAPLLL